MEKIDLNLIREEAENFYKNESLSCSESVLKALVKNFDVGVDEKIVRTASGFSGGIGGSGSICGTLSGAIIGIGLIFGRSEANDDAENKAKELSKKIYDMFKEENNSICCRDLTNGLEKGTSERFNKCYSIIGDVAYETSKILADELNIKY